MAAMQQMEMCIRSSPETAVRAEMVSCGAGEVQRRAVCTREIRRGAVLFDCEPFACMLSSPARAHLCSYCFTSASEGSLLTCTRCSYARYCGKDCQLQDWHGGHRHECPQIKALRAEGCSPGPLDDILLLQRSYFLAHAAAPAQADSGCGVTAQGSVRCGAAHARDLCVSESASFSSELSVHTLAEAVRRVAVAAKRPQQQLLAPLARLSASFPSNNFAVLNALFQSVGAGVFPHAALLNHSCRPNALLTYVLRRGKPPLLRCVALAHIPAGHEVTHCYVDATLPTPLRKAALRKDYGFECDCACCVTSNTTNSNSGNSGSSSSSSSRSSSSASVAEGTESVSAGSVSSALRQMVTAPDPLAVRDLLASLSPEQLAALQGPVDILQSQEAQEGAGAEVQRLLAAATSQIVVLRADGAAARDGAPQALLGRLRTVRDQLTRLVRLQGPFHANTYNTCTALFNDVLAETLLLQPLCHKDGALQEAFDACKRLASTLCAHICAYLALTLRCFPFHPLLGLQLLTLGQLAQQAPQLAWAVQVLSECNGSRSGLEAAPEGEGCLTAVLREAQAELASCLGDSR